MTKTKHPYDETHAEKIERWAIGAVTDDQAQQLALVSLLLAFSDAAGEHGDVEPMINAAMYAVFKQSDSLHDEAIKWLVSAREEDRAVEFDAKKRKPRAA